MTRSELLEALNGYKGEDIWNDVIYPSGLLDRDATEAADPNYMNDTIILVDGTRIDFDYQAGAWKITAEPDDEAIELDWEREENPCWDSTGTIAESWTAEHGKYVARIDRFRDDDGGGYAYSVSIDGNFVKGGENESADSFEEAEKAVLRLITR